VDAGRERRVQVEWVTVQNINFIDNYLVYSSWEGDNQQFWIAKMANASNLSSNLTTISKPGYE
jgi:hypothetical protein